LAPQPLCWVAAVDNIEQAVSHCGYNPGKIIEVTRDDLRWRLTVPENGELSFGGVLPVLIEWPNGKKPCPKNAGEQRAFATAYPFSSKPKKNQRYFIQAKNFGPNKY
jgi:hypothetical protein